MKDNVIELMVLDIVNKAQELDDTRLRLFVNWLSARVKSDLLQREYNEENFNLALTGWFESLNMQNVLWEYRIVMEEVEWWHDLDSQRLHYFRSKSKTKNWDVSFFK